MLRMEVGALTETTIWFLLKSSCGISCPLAPLKSLLGCLVDIVSPRSITVRSMVDISGKPKGHGSYIIVGAIAYSLHGIPCPP